MADAIPTAGATAGNAATAGTATSNTSAHAKFEAGDNNASTSSSSNNAGGTVSLDDFKALQQGVGKLFAGMRELQESLKTVNPQQVKKQKEDELSLSARLEALENEKKALANSKRLVAIKSSASDNGVHGFRNELLVDYLQKSLGDRIAVDDFGEASVRDDTGGSMPLATYVRQFIGTDKGATFIAAPSTSSMPAAGQGAKYSTRHRFAEMSREQILGEMKANPAGWTRQLGEYLKHHREDAKAKGF